MLSTKIWLEANTERSESNPGRSLGVKDKKKVAVWKTVPCIIMRLLIVPGYSRFARYRLPA